jgi:hypothetical protein
MTGIPEHLPRKLAISSWIWSWIAGGGPGEPYENLETCMVGLKERGFNALRADVGLNWGFTIDGRPRGEMAFRQWIEGYGWNLATVCDFGGARHDVLERVIHLLELAKKHGVYVILTSWEYQDSSWHVADPAIRAEVMGVPIERRFMRMAEQMDRLLMILGDRGLKRNIAFVEVHNEPEHSLFPEGPESVDQHTAAIAMLRERHPDVMVSADFSSHKWEIVPANAQVFDQHIYAGGDWYFKVLYGQTVLADGFDPAHPRRHEPLARVLRDGDLVPWDEFMIAAENIRPFWRPVDWMFENLDNEKWDRWLTESYAEWEEPIHETARKYFALDAHEAQRRGLPLVLDEGGFFYPPRYSRFEVDGPGLSLLDLFTDLAIEHDYWGYMPGTYTGPEQLVWGANPEWLRMTNERFRSSE